MKLLIGIYNGGAEIASTGKCKYGKVKYKVAKCVRVENTSTENSSTATQGWKTQVWKIKVLRVSRVGKCKYGKIEYGITINCRKRAAEEPTESLRRIFDRQTLSSESRPTAAATVAFNDIESSMYKRRRMQMSLLPTTAVVFPYVLWERVLKVATDNRDLYAF